MSDLIHQAFDPEIFRRKGHEMIDLLADYLHDIQNNGSQEKVLNQIPPEALFEKWKEDYQNPQGAFYEEVLRTANHLHHPNYVGHQTSVTAPDAVLAELFGALLDTGMGVYEQGNTGVVLERLIIEILSEKIGIPVNQSSGFLTSGGTLGNLTALLCARSVMIDEDVWSKGYQGQQYTFLVSEEAHYSIDRAVRVMGLGAAGLVKVPVDEYFRMDASQLEKYYQHARSQGAKVLGVIANTCTTAVGAHDPIEEIADFCAQHKLWLHVDAAHGGGLLFSKKYRHFLQGLERADSVILDFHKMLLTPSLVTAVVFKNGNNSYQTFAQKASYLWDNSESHEWYNLAKRTFELTKTTMSYRVYILLRNYREKLFATYVDRQYDLARAFAKIIQETGVFAMPVATPESNIICFRYIDQTLSTTALDNLNLAIRERLVQTGHFFIVQTRIKDQVYLRTTLVNPFTTITSLRNLLQEIQEIASALKVETH